jgi:putative Mn2+ efflux pump MntP
MGAAALKIAVVALSLALDVFAVSVGVGMRGVGIALKVRIGAAFASAEIGMTLIGVLIGKLAGAYLGEAAAYLGFTALVLVGAYMVYETRQAGEGGTGFDLSRGWGLFLAALSISLDSLGIGFSILFIGVPLPVSLICIGVASVTSTTLGLTLGKALGKRAEESAGVWAGIVLIATGLGFGALHYFHAGM